MQEQIMHYANKLRFEIDSSDLYSALQNDEKIIVIDARASANYELSHIPHAINIPHKAMSETTTCNLDKSYLYVIYCDGIGCNASTKGALNMAELGFNVKELLGGLDWWIRDGYATQGKNAVESKSLSCGC